MSIDRSIHLVIAAFATSKRKPRRMIGLVETRVKGYLKYFAYKPSTHDFKKKLYWH